MAALSTVKLVKQNYYLLQYLSVKIGGNRIILHHPFLLVIIQISCLICGCVTTVIFTVIATWCTDCTVLMLLFVSWKSAFIATDTPPGGSLIMFTLVH